MEKTMNSEFEENIFSDSTGEVSRGILIAVMNVEIRPGQKEKIYIHEMDNEYELAQNFVLKHSLPVKALPILQKQIQSNKQAVRESIILKPPQFDPISNQQNDEKEDEEQTMKKQQSQHFLGRNSIVSNPKSQSMSRSRSIADVTNRLYNENLQKSKYLSELEQKTLLKLQKIQSQPATYAPQINAISNALASNRRKSTTIEDHLVELGNLQTIRKQRAASIKIKQELESCSFKPILNRVTTKLTHSRPEPTFSRALSRNTQKSKDNLFKPSLNKMSKQIMQNKAPFMARQKQYQQIKQAKINKMYKQKKRNQTSDPVSGIPYFKPSSSGYKSKMWNQNKMNIGEYLYQKGRIKNPPPVEQHQLKINQYSEQLVRNRQSKRIVWIFGQLDSDQDGLISSHKINIESVPDNILEIIMPILFQMQQFGFQLNLEQFKQALTTLHKTLSTTQKSILYDYKKS